MFAASDEDSGYAAWVLPALRWAVERQDRAALAQEAQRYAERLRAMSVFVDGIAR
jgi:hypothetical protein